MKRRFVISLLLMCLLLAALSPTAFAEELEQRDVKDTLTWGNYSVNNLDTGKSQSFSCQIPEGGAAVLVFVGENCFNSQMLLEDLNQCKWVDNAYVELVVMEMTNAPQDAVAELMDNTTYNISDYLDVYYGTAANMLSFNYYFEYSDSVYMTMPQVVILTQDASGRTMRYGQSPVLSAEDIYDSLCAISEKFVEYEADKAAGKVSSHVHDFSDWENTTPPSCTQSGIKSRICDCGKKIDKVAEPVGHKMDTCTVTKFPTETAQGELTYTCTRCSQNVTGVLPAIGTSGMMDSGDLNTEKPDKQSLIDGWEAILEADEFFVEQPSTTAPYTLGELTDEALESALSYLNYVRYTVNLPQVQMADDLNVSAQYGAVVLAANEYMTHYPEQPADMDQDFYQKGYAATTTSNLYYSYGGYGNILQHSIQGYMDEDGLTNLFTLGHRRWLMDPQLQKVGFGYAVSKSGMNFSTTKVMDRSGAVVDYDILTWPASGNFPSNLFSKLVPWSVTLNPEKYQAPDLEEVVVVLTRKSDNQVWVFDKSTGEPDLSYDTFLVVNNDGYGVENCIIFYPALYEISKYEGIYTVSVSGIYTSDGTPTTVNFEVDFFDVTECLEHNYVSEEIAPTCTVPGYTKNICTLCNSSYVTGQVPALGHTEVIDPAVDATCTTEGKTEGSHCSVCSEILVGQNTIASLGHSWSDWTVLLEPTYTAEGQRERICAACGERQTETLDMLQLQFVDVAADQYYAEPVQWAVRSNVTNGTSATTFSPKDKCLREQVVTFLWRACGEPEPTTTDCPFTDVKTTAYYYKAVLWAVENGITTGVSATTFGTGQPCTRAQVVTFLWRAAQQPSHAMLTCPFGDVSSEAYYYNAMLWAVENGITTGMSATEFQPNGTCIRAQIVTFLYRYMTN